MKTLLQVTFVALIALTGCSYVWDDKPPYDLPKAEEAASTVASQVPAAGLITSAEAEAEIVWEVPTQPVEFYRLSYGAEPSRLDQSVRIPVATLQKLDDPKFGPIYSYTLRGVSRTEPLFISLRAENRQGLSDAAEIVSAAPNAR